jgi:hypothetical protein
VRSREEELHLWDVAGRKELRRFTSTGQRDGPVAFLRDGKTVAVAGAGG